MNSMPLFSMDFQNHISKIWKIMYIPKHQFPKHCKKVTIMRFIVLYGPLNKFKKC